MAVDGVHKLCIALQEAGERKKREKFMQLGTRNATIEDDLIKIIIVGGEIISRDSFLSNGFNALVVTKPDYTNYHKFV